MISATPSLAQQPPASTLPLEARQALLLDAAARDRATARRACLLRTP